MRQNYKFLKSVLLVFAVMIFASPAFAQTLYEMPQGVESRVASGENPTGERGKGGQANGGRKGAATVSIKAGASRVLAEATNTSGTVRRIWMTFPDRTPEQLRSYKIEMY